MIQGISRYVLGAYDDDKAREVYNKAKELYTNPTPPPSGGFVENTMDIILADMGPNEPGVFTVMTHGGQPQAKGGSVSKKDLFTRDLPGFNAWNEIELQGDPSKPTSCDGGGACGNDGCLKSYYPDGYTANINVRVEFGKYYGYYMDKNRNWHQFTERLPEDGGVKNPREGSVFGARRQCDQAYFTNVLDANDSRTGSLSPIKETNGTASVKPDSYFRWHGFGGNHFMSSNTGQVRCIFVQQYARLIMEDPNGPDELDNAHFVMHVASDHKGEGGQTTEGSTGISRFKKLTRDWQPINMWTENSGCSEADFISNPPPFHSNI